MTGPEFDNTLRSFNLSLRAHNKSKHTVRQYTDSASRFFAQAQKPPAEVTTDDVNAWLVGMREDKHMAEATVRHYYAGLLAFFKWLSEEEMPQGWINPMLRVPAPTVSETTKDVVPVEKMAELLKDLDARKQYRDAALISLFYDCGVRCSEAVNMRWQDVDFDEGTVTVPRTKNRQVRTVPMSDQTAFRLDRWSRNRADKDTPWVWMGDRGRLTRSGIYQLVKRLFEAKGLPHISPHDLRHTFATHYLADPRAREGDLMAIAGWAPGSERMLQRYTRQGQQRRAIEAHRRLSPVARL